MNYAVLKCFIDRKGIKEEAFSWYTRRSPSCLRAPWTGFVLPTDPAVGGGHSGRPAHLWGGGGLLNRSQLFCSATCLCQVSPLPSCKIVK